MIVRIPIRRLAVLTELNLDAIITLSVVLCLCTRQAALQHLMLDDELAQSVRCQNLHASLLQAKWMSPSRAGTSILRRSSLRDGPMAPTGSWAKASPERACLASGPALLHAPLCDRTRELCSCAFSVPSVSQDGVLEPADAAQRF